MRSLTIRLLALITNAGHVTFSIFSLIPGNTHSFVQVRISRWRMNLYENDGLGWGEAILKAISTNKNDNNDDDDGFDDDDDDDDNDDDVDGNGDKGW